MFVPVEVIAVILSAVGLLVTLGSLVGASFAWVVRRLDRLESRLDSRIDAGDTALGTRIDAGNAALDTVNAALGTHIDAGNAALEARIGRMDARIDKLAEELGAVKDELTEVKIAVARLEGPERRFYAAAR